MKNIIPNIAGVFRTASRKTKKLAVSLGGVTFDEPSLFNNLIAFGVTGSGKRASVVYPILDSVTGLYNSEDSKAPDAKWGGFVLDARGDLHDAIIYTMQKHGRDPLNDLVVLRPDADCHVLELEETTTGERFFVSCTGGASQPECDQVLARAAGPEGVLSKDSRGHSVLLLSNGDQESLSSLLFSACGKFRRPEIQRLLSRLEFDVDGLQVRWLGWRELTQGRLTRVTNTENRKFQVATVGQGIPITTKTPKRLRYVGVHSINNGLTYNLIPKDTPSTEAASRLMQAAEATSDAFGSDNPYWPQASEKHIAHCIELFRQVEGPVGHECSVNDIQRFTSDENHLKEYLSKLEVVIRRKQEMGASDSEILLLRNLKDYFLCEWVPHDPVTKGNIARGVTHLFGDLTRTDQLLKTFCQPSRFGFEDCLSEGKVYILVPGAYPNSQMLIGACMKLDFQQTVRKRTQPGHVNKQRFLMFLADDYQFFITTSGGSGRAGGDEKFLSVSRQTRVFNFICAQGVSSLLAVQKNENKVEDFLACFGSRIFLRNLDQKTNQLAEITGGRTGEKQNRIEASVFTEMEAFEAVLFNKGARPGKQIVRADLRQDAKFYARDSVRAVVNDYYRASLENRAHELGIGHLFDPTPSMGDAAIVKCRLQGALHSWKKGNPLD
jgi:hypothetical protein